MEHQDEWPDLPGYVLEYDSDEDDEDKDDQDEVDGPCSSRNGNVEADGFYTNGKKRKLRFNKIEDRLQSGWLGVFCRKEGASPLYAMVSKPDPVEPTFLLKGTARALSREEARRGGARHASAKAAVTWVALGGFERIYFRPLVTTKEVHQVEKINEFLSRVIAQTERERHRLDKANTDWERTAIAATVVVAQMYHELGVLVGALPDEVEAGSLEGHLPLGEALEVKIPRVKPGPLSNNCHKLTPLAKFVNAVNPSLKGVVYHPYEEVTKAVQTGDLLLFSSVKPSSLVIKLFDHATFGHVGIAYWTRNNELCVWESKPRNDGVIKDGVQVTPLRERVTNGWCNMAAVRHVEGLTPQQRSDMKKTLRDFMQETKDRPYETNKLQLVLSSTDFLDEPFNLLNLNEEDLSSVFCSELVAAAYQRMGLIDRTKCSNRYTPEDFTTRRGLEIMMGTLGPEIYIDLKAMMEDNRRLEKTPLSD